MSSSLKLFKTLYFVLKEANLVQTKSLKAGLSTIKRKDCWDVIRYNIIMLAIKIKLKLIIRNKSLD